MKICILTIATNKYIQFVERLLDNIEENFLNGHEIQCLLFTDHEIEESSDNVKISQIDHEPWPMPTLKRYNYFVKEKEFISQFDYCFYFDVDMALVDAVGDEVLGDLVDTMHPYQSFYPKEHRSYDRNPESLAYVAPGDEGEHYYSGVAAYCVKRSCYDIIKDMDFISFAADDMVGVLQVDCECKVISPYNPLFLLNDLSKTSTIDK